MGHLFSHQHSKFTLSRLFCPFAWLTIIVCGCHDDEPQQTSNSLGSEQTQTKMPALPVGIEVIDPQPVATSDEPVQATMRLSNSGSLSGDSFQLFIDVRIAPGWHIYAADGESGPFAPTRLTLQIPSGVEMAGDWTYPEMQRRMESGTLADVYEGNVSFRADLKLSQSFPQESQTIRCSFEYQACNQFRCLPATTRDLNFRLNQKTRHTPEN
jgi:DsbC/DsbD-like thiol-disulfide interchange protein